MITGLARATAAAVIAVTLAGCMLAEKFQATITIKPDGTFNYKFDGTAVDFLALLAIHSNGSLSAKDEEMLRKRADNPKPNSGIRKIAYLGKGRYDVSFDKDGSPKETYLVPAGLMEVKQTAPDTYRISGNALNPRDRVSLEGIGTKPDGTIEVILPKGASVETHNADSTPGLFSRAYKWRIKSYDQAPHIIFKLKT